MVSIVGRRLPPWLFTTIRVAPAAMALLPMKGAAAEG